MVFDIIRKHYESYSEGTVTIELSIRSEVVMKVRPHNTIETLTPERPLVAVTGFIHISPALGPA